MGKEKRERLSKEQLYGLRVYRNAMFKTLWFIMLITIYFKVGLNPNWHLNDVIIEIVTLFMLLLSGIVTNIKNNFPIFKMRNLNFTKEFSYAFTSFFTLLFFFIIYKNIMEPSFINEIADLSFHDLCTLLVFLFPFSCFIILLLFIGFKIISKDKIVHEKEIELYDNDTEREINKYKVFTVKSVYVLMLISLWAKMGINANFNIYNSVTEIVSVLVISILYLAGNVSNKLPIFHNFHFKVDRYFIYSILLPYALVFIYSIFSSDFRFLLTNIGFTKLLSICVFMSPLFLLASTLFYIGARYPNFFKEHNKKIEKKNKVKFNALLSFVLSLIIMVFITIYTFNIMGEYNNQNILQMIFILIPLLIIIYLVLYQELSKINK